MVALRQAQAVRLQRSLLRRRLHRCEPWEGRELVIGILTDPPAWAGTLPVLELLCMPRQMGETSARKILRQADPPIRENRPLRDLTPRQATLITRALRRDAHRRQLRLAEAIA
jgi:hypothetical protein